MVTGSPRVPATRWPDTLRGFIDVLASSWGDNLISVVLFGSWARGTARPDSDLDLVIVARTLPRSRLDRFRLWHRLAEGVSPDLARRLSVILLTSTEAASTRPYYLDLTEEAVFLYDGDGFFRAILDRLRDRLSSLGAKRVHDPGGHPYWVLKEECAFGEAIEL